MPVDLPDPSARGDVPRAEVCEAGCLVLTVSAERIEAGEWLDQWQDATELSRPRLVLVTELAQDDLEDVAAHLQELVGEDSAIVVRYLPLEDDLGHFGGVLDLATSTIHEYTNASTQAVSVRDCDPEHLLLTSDARADLLTILATRAEDDGVLAAFVAGQPFDVPAEYAASFASGQICPVYPAEAAHEVRSLLDVLR